MDAQEVAARLVELLNQNGIPELYNAGLIDGETALGVETDEGSFFITIEAA